jgi:hypothetical protein
MRSVRHKAPDVNKNIHFDSSYWPPIKLHRTTYAFLRKRKANLVYVDAVVEGPDSLEVVLHPLLQLLRNLVQSEEVLKVPPLGLIKGPPRVHPLNDGGHVSEHDGVHQSCS